MRWLRQVAAVLALERAHDSAAPQFVGGRHRRHCRRRGRLRVGVVDCRGLLGGDGGRRIARPRARAAQRRGQRDDERLRRARRRRRSSRRRASARDGQTPLASAELYVIIDLPKKSTPDKPANVPMRGIEPVGHEGPRGCLDRRGPDVRVRHERGDRRPRRARHSSSAPNVGDTIVSGTESLAGGRRLRGGRRASPRPRSGATRARCRASTGAATRSSRCSRVSSRRTRSQSFRDWLTTNPQLNVMVRRENEYYAAQSQAMTQLIQTIGFGIAGLMGIGAVFGAILTMYTAVATRAREIATLRALGFNTARCWCRCSASRWRSARSAASSAGSGAMPAFNGYQTSTMNFQTFSQVAFAFRVTPELLGMGLVYALAMGFIGGLFPAIRAARLPIPSALQGAVSAILQRLARPCTFSRVMRPRPASGLRGAESGLIKNVDRLAIFWIVQASALLVFFVPFSLGTRRRCGRRRTSCARSA